MLYEVITHADARFPRALFDHVENHRIDALAVRIAEPADAFIRQIARFEHARTDRIVDVA